LNQSDIYKLSGRLGYEPQNISPLKLEASGREYYRIQLADNKTVVLCYLDPKAGSHTKFIQLSNHLLKSNISSPKLIDYDESIGVTIQEDLGDKSLIDIDILNSKNGIYLDESIKLLAQLQSSSIPQLTSMNDSSILGQMNKMENIFLSKFLDSSLGNQLNELTEITLEKLHQQPWMNCHFDFERRNLHINKNNEICVIDYQDLCHGPVGIDLAGILVDHYQIYPKEKILEKLNIYNQAMQLDISASDAFEWLRWGGIQRGMRILGTLADIYITNGRSFRLKDLIQILDNLHDLIPSKYKVLKESISSEVKPRLISRIDSL